MKLLLEERPLWIGTLGTIGTIILENIHLAVGILVGLTTLVYLLLKIRRELRASKTDPGRK